MKLFIICLLIVLSSIEIYSQEKAISLELKIGNCNTLEVPNDLTNYNWISGNQDIADVDKNGLVCGINIGLTNIVAVSKTSNKNYQFNIRIVSSDNSSENHFDIDTCETNSIYAESQIILDKILSGQDKQPTDSKIKVSENKRYLINTNTNEPLVFISQTLWSMTRRLTREQIIEILDICVNQGFTAIQLIAHSHYMGENVYGDIPFENNDFLCPIITEGNTFGNELQYDWWDHLEYIINECIKRELIVCLLPTWREQWNQKSNLSKNNVFAYGKFIGSRYRHLNKWIIWIMGGDAAPDTENKLLIQRRLAKGIAVGVNNKELYDNLMMSYHTFGPSMTNTYYPDDEAFMDFNTIQSGQGLNRLEGMIEQSWETQCKPTIDFEPFYDKNGQLQNEARTTILWGIFSGGFGTSYGNWNIWHCGARDDIAKFSIPESFQNSYGAHIKHLKKILTPRFIEYRTPNQNVLINNFSAKDVRILSNSATDSSFVYVFSPKGESFTVDLNNVKGDQIIYKWFNPRNGKMEFQDSIKQGTQEKKFLPPTKGDIFSANDWVLIIEQELTGYNTQYSKKR
jgi:hypothetical protein